MNTDNYIKPLCIYHGNCADGFTSAWIVHKKFGDKYEYIPGIYTTMEFDTIVGLCKDREVLMVDFSYTRDVMSMIIDVATKVTILDHHKTAEENISPLFDLGLIEGVLI